ncbi:MAG: WD40 repeat domain-containing protein [Candidatus Helarchaeota archaeon]
MTDDRIISLDLLTELNRLSGEPKDFRSIISKYGSLTFYENKYLAMSMEAASGAGKHGIILIWDLNSNELFQKYNSKMVFGSLTYPSNENIIIANRNNDFCIYDTLSKEITKTFYDDNVYAEEISASPDGKYFVAPDKWHHAVHLFDTETLTPKSNLYPRTLISWETCSTAYDANLIAVGGNQESGILCIINSVKWKTIKKWNTNKPQISQLIHIDITKDGTKLASSHMDKTIRIWDAKKGKILNTITEKEYPSNIAISPDGKYLVSGLGFKEITIRDTKTMNIVETLGGNVDNLYKCTLKFSSDGRYLAYPNNENSVSIFDMKTL